MKPTAARVRQLLDYDPVTGVFTWKVRCGRAKAGTRAGSLHKSDGYRIIGIDGATYYEHRLAWLWMTGNWPFGEIDHQHLDKINNAFSELRPATHAQNAMNTPLRSNNTSGFKGVDFRHNRKKWRARIKVKGRKLHLGYFLTPQEAHAAYVAAAAQHFGVFARP